MAAVPDSQSVSSDSSSEVEYPVDTWRRRLRFIPGNLPEKIIGVFQKSWVGRVCMKLEMSGLSPFVSHQFPKVRWDDGKYTQKIDLMKPVSKSQRTVGFFGLPLEIRLAIYDYVIPECCVTCVWTFDWDGRHMDHKILRKSCRGYGPTGHNAGHWSHPGCHHLRRFDPTEIDLPEVPKLMMVSKAFHSEILAFISRYRSWVFQDVQTFIGAGISLQPMQLHSIRTVHLYTKSSYLSFLDTADGYPRIYRRLFKHLPSAAPLKKSEKKKASSDPRLWDIACYMLGKMQGLRVLRMQLCYYSFSELQSRSPFDERRPRGYLACDEGLIFKPLLEMAKTKGKSLHVLDLEVDWPDSCSGWDEEFQKRGTKLVRTTPWSSWHHID